MTDGRRPRVAAIAFVIASLFSASLGTRYLVWKIAPSLARATTQLGDSIAWRTRIVVPGRLPESSEGRLIAALDGRRAPAAHALDGAPSARQASDSPSSPCSEPTERCGFPKPVGVFVSRDRVLAAARAGLRPSGSPVPANAWRPAGVALHGVEGLGVGLREGDVLVVPSEAAVVGQVIAALRRHAPSMSGVAWRGRQRIFITVELPDLGKVDTTERGRQTP